MEGQYQPPGLTLDKDESDEGVSGINVRRIVERREGRGCSSVYHISFVIIKSNS